jgi:hypothetical protein
MVNPSDTATGKVNGDAGMTVESVVPSNVAVREPWPGIVKVIF